MCAFFDSVKQLLENRVLDVSCAKRGNPTEILCVQMSFTQLCLGTDRLFCLLQGQNVCSERMLAAGNINC